MAMRENPPKTGFDTCFTKFTHFYTIAHGQYTHFGSMLSQRQRLNTKFEKNDMFLRICSPDSMADFPVFSKT